MFTSDLQLLHRLTNATPKGNMFCQHMQAHLQILLIMKKGYKQVNEKDF